MERFNPNQLLPIEAELIKEKGSALARTGANLERFIAELARLADVISKSTGADRLRHVRRHREVLELATDEKWKMIVQREAMGLSRHDDVDRFYPLPKPIPE